MHLFSVHSPCALHEHHPSPIKQHQQKYRLSNCALRLTPMPAGICPLLPEQSAYFSFSAFLQWSDQPIYVLDKDNDLNMSA